MKIATCCYCGTRAALQLRGKTHHELSCGSCGAPLQAMKMLRIDPVRATAPAATPARPEPRRKPRDAPKSYREKPKKRKKRKSFKRRAWEEFWDAVEDIFD